jgi:hypothetical protein
MLSPEMSARIEAIRKSLQGEDRPDLIFAYDIAPKLKYNNGMEKYILTGTPAGFSWIGFILSAYIFTYIRNYRVFWVWGGLRFIAAILQVALNTEFQFSTVADLALCVLCGFWLPYNRLRAIDAGVKEHSVANAIVLTLILGFIAVSPGALVEVLGALFRM